MISDLTNTFISMGFLFNGSKTKEPGIPHSCIASVLQASRAVFHFSPPKDVPESAADLFLISLLLLVFCVQKKSRLGDCCVNGNKWWLSVTFSLPDTCSMLFLREARFS